MADYIAMDIRSIALHVMFLVAALSGISMLAIFISAYVLARRKQYSVITMRENEIELSGGVSDAVDCFGYEWIDKVEQNSHGLIFCRQSHPAYYVFLARHKFTDDEYSTLLGWLVNKGLL